MAKYFYRPDYSVSSQVAAMADQIASLQNHVSDLLAKNTKLKSEVKFYRAERDRLESELLTLRNS